MPWADYTCPTCGSLVRNHVFSAAQGAVAAAPRCPDPVCGDRMAWIPAIGRMDAASGSTFKAFSVTRLVPTAEGPQQVVETIDSLHKLRQVEADSEQRYRNGEGEPLRFRLWNNEASNRDQNTFGTTGTIGDRTYGSGVPLEKHGRVSVTRHGDTEPDVPIGPGMTDAYTPL